MIIISLTYTASLDAVDSHLAAHVAWLKQGIADGWLLVAGRQVPRTGGILIARGTLEDVARLAATDPFVMNGVADVRLTEFQPSLVAGEVTLGSLVGMIALIDYGAGNLRSVHNALLAAGAEDVAVTADADVVAKADRIVLPGVGAFRACIDPLRAIPGMITAMHEAVFSRGRPFLGICVGMQLLADAGEEFGRHEGLGWIGGTVRRIEPGESAVKIPHMGWNDVDIARPHDLIEPGEAYFLHSYQFEATDAADVVATTSHGGPLTAAVGRDNLLGVQFHPEKSQAYGLATLARFLAWKP